MNQEERRESYKRWKLRVKELSLIPKKWVRYRDVDTQQFLADPSITIGAVDGVTPQIWEPWQLAEVAALRAELDTATATIARQAEELVTTRWACFHCGFETADPKKAEAHFGERDDAAEFTPLCTWWASMSPEERGETLQDTIRELNAERDENAIFRTRIEGLEYRVEGQLSEIHSFAPFRKCDSIQQIFNVYDSMEGRALAAEEERDALRDGLEKLVDSLKTADPILCNVGQLIEGWFVTTPAAEWGKWDEEVRQDRSKLHRDLTDALAAAQALLAGAASGEPADLLRFTPSEAAIQKSSRHYKPGTVTATPVEAGKAANKNCGCYWNRETGYFEPCCEQHEQEYVAHLEEMARQKSANGQDK